MADERFDLLQTLWQYSDCMTEGRVDALSRLFTAEGVLAIPGKELVGPQQIEKHLAASQRRRNPIVNLVFNPVITIDGEHGTARSSFLVINRAGRPEFELFGYYIDELVSVDGAWMFKRRQVQPITSLPGWASRPLQN